jgi:hypothetical protein
MHLVVQSHHVIKIVVADGYLSDDERAVDGVCSDGEDDSHLVYTADMSAPSKKEHFLHSVMNESVTNYLNALLNAKNTNQIIIISDDPGESESPCLLLTLS